MLSNQRGGFTPNIKVMAKRPHLPNPNGKKIIKLIRKKYKSICPSQYKIGTRSPTCGKSHKKLMPHLSIYFK